MFNKASATLPTSPVDYPSGVCVKVDGNYYYVNGKYLHPIIGMRIRESWSFPFVVTTTQKALSKYTTAGRLGFRDGSLVRDVSTNTIYFISKRLRRAVCNPDVLTSLGLTFKDAVWVSAEELTLHQEGEVLK